MNIPEFENPFLLTVDQAFKLAHRHIKISAMACADQGNTPEAMAKHQALYKAVKSWLHASYSLTDIQAAAERFIAQMPK